jgi:lysophospholipase L1-like esterase
MSIDLYPYLDLERRIGAEAPTDVGAASLLYRDLREIWLDLQYANFAVDGATTFDVLNPAFEAKLEPFRDAKALVTLTLGGNDALGLITKRGQPREALDEGVQQIIERYDAAVAMLVKALPNAKFILTTIYDPSDGTGALPGFSSDGSWLQYLGAINDHIRQFAKANGHSRADVHIHFLGHGLSVNNPDDRYFWHANPIEPSAKGAEVIAGLWWSAAVKSFS